VYRPREKLLALGIQNLSVAELLQVLLSSGSRTRSVNVIAEEAAKVISRKKEEERPLTIQDFQRIRGIGRVKAMQILVALELGHRLFSTAAQPIIDSAEVAFSYVKHLVDKRQEYLFALYLNARYELVYKRTIFIGKVDASIAHPREIFSYAFVKNAYNIILAHNHPSGDLQPSLADIETTQAIVSAGQVLGITILDHIIVGRNGFRSMKEMDII